MSDATPSPTPSRFDRWRAWCAAHGVVAPTPEDFLAHGRLSTLERLAPEIAVSAPTEAAALRAALRTLRREKRERGASRATGGRRGPVQTLSVDEADLPPAWRGVLDRWRAERRRLDAGGILFGDRQPPAADIIDDIAYILRAIGKVCVDAGRPMTLSDATIAAWLDAAEARGCKASGLGLQLGLVLTFLAATDADAALRNRVAEMRATMRQRAAHTAKLKEAWLRDNPTSLGDIWSTAEALLEEAMTIPATRYQRAKLVREAAALALGVAVPLRIGDLGRFVIRVFVETCAGAAADRRIMEPRFRRSFQTLIAVLDRHVEAATVERAELEIVRVDAHGEHVGVVRTRQVTEEARPLVRARQLAIRMVDLLGRVRDHLAAEQAILDTIRGGDDR